MLQNSERIQSSWFIVSKVTLHDDTTYVACFVPYFNLNSRRARRSIRPCVFSNLFRDALVKVSLQVARKTAPCNSLFSWKSNAPVRLG